MSKALAFRRKSPRAEDLEKARDGRDAATAKLAELGAQRANLLLTSADDGAIAALDLAIADQQRIERAQADRLRLIEEEIRKEEATRQAQRRADHVERQVAKLAEADEAAAQLVGILESSVVPLFDRLVSLREEVGAAANLPLGQIEGANLTASAIRTLLSFEFYRLSARPMIGAARGLPGAKCPQIDAINQPETIKPFATAMREGSAFAAQSMRGAK